MRILKEIAYWFFILTGVSWIAARLNRRKILVLTYHGVYGGALDPVLNFDGLHVRIERFERQMRYLAARYSVVGLDQLLEGEPGGKRGKPLAAVTFDDGYSNIYHHAYPVLKRLALPATVFVITDFLQFGRARWWDRLRAMVASTRCPVVRFPIQGTERRLRLVTVAHKQAALRLLTEELRGLPPQRIEALLARLAEDLAVEERQLETDRPLGASQLREMVGGGISVGGHGRSHDSFLHLSREHLLAELTESKRVLESVTGRPVHWLAYPYGYFSRQAVAAAVEAGYRGAFACGESLHEGDSDPFAVRRIGVADSMTPADFIVAVSGLREFLKRLLRVCRLWGVAGGEGSARTAAGPYASGRAAQHRGDSGVWGA